MKKAATRRWWILLVVAVVAMAASFYFDQPTYQWMKRHENPTVLAIMRGVSHWGDWPSHVAAGLICGAIAYIAGSRYWFAIFATMLISCAVAGSINRVIKISAGRSRPAVEVDAGWNGPRFGSKYNAFPSGHTASSTSFFAVLCIARRRIGLALLPVPAVIAFSRVYLGAHYLSDVVCGIVLGIACAALVYRFVFAKIAPDAVQQSA